MKLDWDVVRTILASLEDASAPDAYVDFTDFPGLDPQVVGYHMGLLAEHGLLRLATDRILYSTSGDGLILGAAVSRLTLDGHKLLDNIRSDSVWTKVKKHFADAALPMTVGAVAKVAEKILETQLLK
jgi:hypothetical protein